VRPPPERERRPSRAEGAASAPGPRSGSVDATTRPPATMTIAMEDAHATDPARRPGSREAPVRYSLRMPSGEMTVTPTVTSGVVFFVRWGRGGRRVKRFCHSETSPSLHA
jgi:hypothetical protein